jgi:hypothetical protein
MALPHSKQPLPNPTQQKSLCVYLRYVALPPTEYFTPTHSPHILSQTPCLSALCGIATYWKKDRLTCPHREYQRYVALPPTEKTIIQKPWFHALWDAPLAIPPGSNPSPKNHSTYKMLVVLSISQLVRAKHPAVARKDWNNKRIPKYLRYCISLFAFCYLSAVLSTIALAKVESLLKVDVTLPSRSVSA